MGGTLIKLFLLHSVWYLFVKCAPVTSDAKSIGFITQQAIESVNEIGRAGAITALLEIKREIDKYLTGKSSAVSTSNPNANQLHDGPNLMNIPEATSNSPTRTIRIRQVSAQRRNGAVNNLAPARSNVIVVNNGHTMTDAILTHGSDAGKLSHQQNPTFIESSGTPSLDNSMALHSIPPAHLSDPSIDTLENILSADAINELVKDLVKMKEANPSVATADGAQLHLANIPGSTSHHLPHDNLRGIISQIPQTPIPSSSHPDGHHSVHTMHTAYTANEVHTPVLTPITPTSNPNGLHYAGQHPALATTDLHAFGSYPASPATLVHSGSEVIDSKRIDGPLDSHGNHLPASVHTYPVATQSTTENVLTRSTTTGSTSMQEIQDHILAGILSPGGHATTITIPLNQANELLTSGHQMSVAQSPASFVNQPQPQASIPATISTSTTSTSLPSSSSSSILQLQPSHTVTRRSVGMPEAYVVPTAPTIAGGQDKHTANNLGTLHPV